MSFGYGPDNGPHRWATFCAAAGGVRQSPINLKSDSVFKDAALPALKIDLAPVVGQTLLFAKHNFQLAGDGNGSLSGGPLVGDYKFVQCHFHWGSGNDFGSEHLLDGKSYASELHLVFMNSKYPALEEALKNPDGLAVVGVFISVNDSSELAPMTTLCSSLCGKKAGDKVVLESPVALQQFLPADTSKFYTYPGSLTTPPCSECVTWLVLETPVAVSPKMMDCLRQTHKDCSDCCTTDNYRTVCPIGTRQVKKSFD